MNKPFEGDTFIKPELVKLRDRFWIKHCVETGTQYGSTTLELFKVFHTVVSIEADRNYFKAAKERLSLLPISILFGRSQDRLKGIKSFENVLYYLDAHGCDIGGCPLKEELEIIAAKEHKTVCIVIHDFKVPGKDFGFDAYDYELSYDEIKPQLEKIYPAGYEFHYNSEANGANRGVIFIYPKTN